MFAALGEAEVVGILRSAALTPASREGRAASGAGDEAAQREGLIKVLARRCIGRRVHLHGVWIDATLDVDDIREQINAMLAASSVENAEEYAIHDHEGFGSYQLHEYAGIQAAHEAACFIAGWPDFGAALLEHMGSIEDARRMAEENYCGCYHTLADYAQELTEETTEIPQALVYYIDYEAMARDMEMSGDIFTLDTDGRDVHVFWNR